jgi:hypothetical protein
MEFCLYNQLSQHLNTTPDIFSLSVEFWKPGFLPARVKHKNFHLNGRFCALESKLLCFRTRAGGGSMFFIHFLEWKTAEPGSWALSRSWVERKNILSDSWPHAEKQNSHYSRTSPQVTITCDRNENTQHFLGIFIYPICHFRTILAWLWLFIGVI